MNVFRKRVQVLAFCFMLGVPVVLLAMFIASYKYDADLFMILLGGFCGYEILFLLPSALGGKFEESEAALDRSFNDKASHLAVVVAFGIILLGNIFVALCHKYAASFPVISSDLIVSVALLGLVVMVLAKPFALLCLYRSFIAGNLLPDAAPKKEKRKLDIEEVYSLSMLGLIFIGTPAIIGLVKVGLWSLAINTADVFWLSVEIMLTLAFLLYVYRTVKLAVAGPERPKFYKTISLIASRQSFIILFYFSLLGLISFPFSGFGIRLTGEDKDKLFVLAFLLGLAAKLVFRSLMIMQAFYRYGSESDSEELDGRIRGRIFFWELSDMGREAKFSLYALLWLISLVLGYVVLRFFACVLLGTPVYGLLSFPKIVLFAFVLTVLGLLLNKLFGSGKLDERDRDIARSADRTAVVVAFGLLLLCLIYFQSIDWKKEELYTLTSGLYEVVISSLVVLVLVRSATVLYLYRKFGDG